MYTSTLHKRNTIEFQPQVNSSVVEGEGVSSRPIYFTSGSF